METKRLEYKYEKKNWSSRASRKELDNLYGKNRGTTLLEFGKSYIESKRGVIKKRSYTNYLSKFNVVKKYFPYLDFDDVTKV